MSRQTVTTTVKEYDEKGRVVKETTTVTSYDWYGYQVVYPTINPRPYRPWYQTTTGNPNYSSSGIINTPAAQ